MKDSPALRPVYLVKVQARGQGVPIQAECRVRPGAESNAADRRALSASPQTQKVVTLMLAAVELGVVQTVLLVVVKPVNRGPAAQRMAASLLAAAQIRRLGEAGQEGH